MKSTPFLLVSLRRKPLNSLVNHTPPTLAIAFQRRNRLTQSFSALMADALAPAIPTDKASLSLFISFFLVLTQQKELPLLSRAICLIYK